MRRLNRSQRRKQLGLSMVELMVGVTVGMIVVAGAVTMVVSQITEHRRLMLETQVQQDLRAAADMMMREMRRAGFWEQAQAGVWSPGTSTPLLNNPYVAMTPASAAAGQSSVAFSVSSADRNSVPENNLADPAERFGFSLQDDTLEYTLAGDKQPLTDPHILKITGFSVKLDVQTVGLQDFCPGSACDPATMQCPAVEVRAVTVTIAGEATHDPAVKREVVVRSRLRNDNVTGAGSCPA
ncbi:MAG TPA: prepilin-type N-terminal cleavage/methylation domain-containing protein [Burkholderiaceae bacterium]